MHEEGHRSAGSERPGDRGVEMSRVLGALQTKSSLRSVCEGTDSVRETSWVVHRGWVLKIGQGGVYV